MRTAAKLVLGEVAVGAENLEAFGPSVTLEPAVEYGTAAPDLLTMLCTVILDVIYGEKMPIGLSAADALTTIRSNHLTTTLTVPLSSLPETSGTVFCGL